MLLISVESVFPSENKDLFYDYVFENCDKASVCFPNFRQKNGTTSIRMNKDFEEYMAKNEDIVREISPHILRRYLSKSYFVMKYRHVCDIYVFNLFKEFKRKLRNTPNLFDWQYPNLPEDICFFRKNSLKCWLQVIAHENYAYIFDETEQDEKMLIDCGIQYIRMNQSIETPKVKL